MRAQRVAAMLVAACLCGTAVMAAAQVVDEDRRLARMAALAESPEQHSRVAEQYRDRAAVLDAEAGRYERIARRLEKRWFPNDYKAPSMLRPGYQERQKAANARSAAREVRVLAERHSKIAVDLRNAPE